MGVKKDLTGKRFGRLVVVGRSPEMYVSPKGKTESCWLCRCDCGNEAIVKQSALVSGKTRSCGCLHSEIVSGKAKNMVGQRFGRLVVVAPADIDKRANGVCTGWKCVCDCGKEIIATRQNLISGDAKSCGCFHLETSAARIAEDGENATGRFEGTAISLITPERGANKNSKSGIKGVSWNKSKGKWVATMRFKNRQIYLGAFTNIEDAIKARKAAEEKYFEPTIKAYRESRS